MLYFSFCDCLISLCVMFSIFYLCLACVKISFFLRLNNIALYVYTTFCLSIPSSMHTRVVYSFWLFQLLLLWTWAQKYIWVLAFSSFGFIPRSGIARSYYNSNLYFWRNCHTFFHSSRIILFQSARHRGSNFSTFLSTLVIFHLFCIIVILVYMKWYLIVVMIFISLITCDAKHLFMYSLVICLSGGKCLSKFSVHFIIGMYLL